MPKSPLWLRNTAAEISRALFAGFAQSGIGAAETVSFISALSVVGAAKC